MDDLLLLMLGIIGLFAIYWALFGQWKHNKMMREAEEAASKRQEANQQKKDEKREPGKPNSKEGNV